MWIKDKYGDYVNMDHASYVYKDYDGSTCVHVGGSEHEISNYDVRDEIIANIISGTPVMEVR